MKSIKYVDYAKSHKQGERTLHPIITLRVKGYNRMLNAPRYVCKIVPQPQIKLGY